MNNIILIGMPASGKSTIGVILAKTLAMDFFDTDLVIQKQQNCTLQELINRDGIQTFLEYEEIALLYSVDLINGSTVIATGGSAVFSEKGMNALKKNGFCVYLKSDLNELKDRLSGIKTRGVAAAPEQSVDDILTEREPLYLKYADAVIDTSGFNAEETVEAIISAATSK